MSRLQPYEGTPVRVLTEDGYEYRHTFWVRIIQDDESFIIYHHRFYDMQEADEFCVNFNWMKFNPADWTE